MRASASLIPAAVASTYYPHYPNFTMFALTFRPSLSQGVSSIFILLLTRRILQSIIYRFKTTRLHGPTAASKIFGISQTVAKSRDPGALYESWVTEYGAAFRVNGPFITERIVLCDPRAISHVCNLDAGRYSQTPTNARLLSNIVRLSYALISKRNISISFSVGIIM